MSIDHLHDAELELVLGGETLPAHRLEHLQDCVVCRRRRDGFLQSVELAAGADPGADELAILRDAALQQWGQPPARAWWRWAAAAAAVAVLALLPLLKEAVAPRAAVNTDAVLEEVDQVLARDPLASMAPQDVLEEVVPQGQETNGRSVS
jgi:hypothetical protein